MQLTGSLSFIDELLFPPRCILCGEFLPRDCVDLCRHCRTEAEEYPYGSLHPAPKEKIDIGFLDSFTAVWYYENNVRTSIHRYKFRRQVSLAAGYGRLLGMKILKEGPVHIDYLTWVPVSALRRFSRGYDQCQILSKAVGKELGISPVGLLKKIRNNTAQSGIQDHAARRANVQGAYTIHRNMDVSGKRILLLDDVYTTGATVNECARVLFSAGAKEVHCAVIASASRGKHRNSSR